MPTNRTRAGILFVFALALVLGAMAHTKASLGKTSVRYTSTARRSEISQASKSQPTFFPVAVWYSGSKARAPMLETVTADSSRSWKDNLLKIKGLEFNTVRTCPVDVVSSRELSRDTLRSYKLVIVPYPLMLTKEEAALLKEYVADGGRLFVE